MRHIMKRNNKQCTMIIILALIVFIVVVFVCKPSKEHIPMTDLHVRGGRGQDGDVWVED